MKKTPRVSPGQGVRAEHINAMSEAILELQNALAPGKNRPPPQSWDTKPNLWVSEPFNEVPSPGTPVWKVTVTPGYLIYHQLMYQFDVAGSIGLDYRVPKIGSDSIETIPAPKIPITSATGYLYLTGTTLDTGKTNDDASIIFSPTELDSSIHDRPGGTGRYYWVIAEFVPSPSDSSQPTISRRLPGDKTYSILTNGDDGNIEYYDYDVDVVTGDVTKSEYPSLTVYYREGLAYFTDPGGSGTTYEATGVVTAHN